MFRFGEQVLVQSDKGGRWDTEATVVKVVPEITDEATSYVMQTSDGKELWRNAKFIKKIILPNPQNESEEEGEDEEDRSKEEGGDKEKLGHSERPGVDTQAGGKGRAKLVGTKGRQDGKQSS